MAKHDIDLKAVQAVFVEESRGIFDHLEEAIVHLENDPTNKSLLEVIFRGAHTLKGNASMMGFGQMVEFSHGLENLLQNILDKKEKVSSGVISLFLRSVDCLRELLQQALAGKTEINARQQKILKLIKDGRTRAKEEKDESLSDEKRPPKIRKKEDEQPLIERGKTLRVDIDKLDHMLRLAGEMVISRERMKQILEQETSERGKSILDIYKQEDQLYTELQEQVLKIRMVPLGPVFRQYLRTIRDLTQQLNKQVRLNVENEEVEIDTTAVEKLRDPLTHLIRNAVDHGIEAPEVRKKKGKDPCGTLLVKAFHDAGTVVIQLIDDGAGLNRQKIIERGAKYRDRQELEKLDDSDLFQIIFDPGFSTAESVTELSGRGFGLDIVQKNIESLRGSVTVESQVDKGTTFTLRLPLTLAIIEGFLIGVGEERFVLPLETIQECLPLDDIVVQGDASEGIFYLRGQAIPYLQLGKILSCAGRVSKGQNIAVVKVGAGLGGLVVDDLYGASRMVIKHLGKMFNNVRGVLGSAILGDGRIALILDIPNLFRHLLKSTQLSGGNTHSVSAANEMVNEQKI